jgi:nucleoside 2-deoxyribosyltransferase
MHQIAELMNYLIDHSPKRDGRVYLAAPYSTGGKISEEWQEVRYRLVNITAMRLIRAGFVVFSPVSHSHPLSKTQDEKFNTHNLWLGQDVEFLQWADLLVVLALPGYVDSYGVAWERQWFKDHGKPEFILTINDVYKLDLQEEK